MKRQTKPTETTKPKKAFIQTNTLFSYFDSDKPKIKPEPKQTSNSILNYFKSEITNDSEAKPKIPIIKSEENQINVTKAIQQSAVNDNFNIKKKISTQSSLSGLKHTEIKKELKPQLSLASFRQESQVEAKNVSIVKDEPVAKNEKFNSRKCPFYKRVEGTQISVDAFSYGDIENCNAYFLSHYHYDHFIGLKKDFKNQMFCSKVTANLVMKNIKVDKKYITILEMDKFLNVYDNDSVQVALIDANHCPGSVMFLFKLNKLKKYILHTGDFRASEELVENAVFKKIAIDVIYLDTTYLDSYYTFLPQSKIVALGAKVAKNELRAKPNTLIICGTYTIGKERVFIAIAEALDLKVYVSRDKKNIIDCLEDEKLSNMITKDPSETNLHVVQMGKLNINDLKEYAAIHKEYDNVVAFKPSGWTHNSSTENGLSIEKKSKNIIIYGLEYSEHSSFEELRNCVSTLKPRKVIPTVNCGNKEKRDKMQAYLNEWMKS